MGNMLCMFDIPNMENPEEQVPGILAAIAFGLGICSTIHTNTRTTPMQLVFGRDAILNVNHLADWRYIKSCKQWRWRMTKQNVCCSFFSRTSRKD